MGQTTIRIAPQLDASIVGGFSRQVGNCNGVHVYNDIDNIDCLFDVILDFSSPHCLSDILELSHKANKPLIIASTDHTSKQLQSIKKHSDERATLQASNFSLGINTLLELVTKAAKDLEDFDIQLVEAHHKHKLDSPSGTAKTIVQKLDTQTNTTKKNKRLNSNKVGVHSLRGGSIVGQHTVTFFGNGETLTISHQAHSRDIFALGAIKAAHFIKDKKNGLYTMRDLASH